MQFVTAEHLGGYVQGGDPNTYAPEVWEYFMTLCNVKSVLDIGAGEGHAANWFHKKGCKVMAIEGDPNGYRVCCENLGKESAILHDYTEGFVRLPQLSRYDLVWCCEFVEHVEERFSRNFLHTFQYGDLIAMTHAVPGQPGWHHVNCQPQEYWVNRVESLGLHVFKPDLSNGLRAITRAHWVQQSLLVFAKRETPRPRD